MSPGAGGAAAGPASSEGRAVEPPTENAACGNELFPQARSSWAQLMRRLRTTFDVCGAAHKILLLAVDGSFCNRTVFTTLIPGVELIARARKDIRLCFRAQDGSRRFYGVQKLTPDEPDSHLKGMLTTAFWQRSDSSSNDPARSR